MTKTKVVAIVLDGAPFDVFSSLARKGVLPNMRRLMKKGCFGVLNSTIPPISPVAIPSLLTGKNPGKHGVFGFGYVENGIFRPYTSENIVGETIWDILAAANKKVILLNVPWTFPPFKVNGVMVAGPPSPRNQAESYPSNLLSILESEVGRYYVDLSLKSLDYRGADEEGFLEEAYLVTRGRAKAMHYLMENYKWDLSLTVFTTLDRMQHVFFGYFDEESPLFNAEKRKILVEYYKEIDKILGETFSSLDENTILVVVSDHGFEYLRKYVGINNMLIEGGFAKERSKFQIFTTERILGVLKRIGLGNIKRMISPRASIMAQRIFPRRSDYSKSECYGLTGGAVSINKNNVADKEKHEVLRKRLINFLYSITDEDNGEKIVEKIYDRSEIYHGNPVVDAPDLIIVFKKGYEPHIWGNRIIEPVKPIKNKTVKTGTHIGFSSQRGIFIVSGPGIKEGFQIESNIVDVAPTILHVLGVPVPSDMDGRVLKEIFEPKSRFVERSIKYQTSLMEKKEERGRLSKKEKEEIKSRLKSLGYI